jgi:hypothetical protein
MGLDQGLEGFLVMPSNGLQDNLSQFQATGLGQGMSSGFIRSLPGAVQNRGQLRAATENLG